MPKQTLELVEEYNPQGICIKRTINGFELPPDKEPSIAIFKDFSSLTQKFYMTEQEAKERFNYKR